MTAMPDRITDERVPDDPQDAEIVRQDDTPPVEAHPKWTYEWERRMRAADALEHGEWLAILTDALEDATWPITHRRPDGAVYQTDADKRRHRCILTLRTALARDDYAAIGRALSAIYHDALDAHISEAAE